MNIDEFPEKLALVKLGPGADVPAWAEASSVFQITATATETTVLCARRDVPRKAEQLGPFVGFRVEGRYRPEPEGPVVLPEGTLQVFTFGHDWMLVPVDAAADLAEEWRRQGHRVAPAVPI